MEMPPPPPPVEVPADAPMVPLPVATLRWLALRDLYAEELRAYTFDLEARHTLALAESEANAWLYEGCRADLELVERRPTWSTVAKVGAGGVAVGVVVTVAGLLVVR